MSLFQDALAFAKDQPGVGDVHVSNAGGGGSIADQRRKRRAYARIAERNMAETETKKFVKAESINEELGLVFGWAIVCKVDGEDYYDLQRNRETGEAEPDHIPEASMLESSADFMANSRLGNEMHARPDSGTYLFAFPLTAEIAKAMGITAYKKTGLMIAYKPEPAVLAKFKSGEYTGFSIEGLRIKDEEVA